MALRAKIIKDDQVDKMLKEVSSKLMALSHGKKLIEKSDRQKGIVTYSVIRRNDATGSISERQFDILKEAATDYNS